MSDTQVDNSKRTWLIASTCAGAVGAGFVATPFVSTFQPSERAKAAGAAVEVDISEVKPGEKLTVEWRGKPVWIMRRTTEQVVADCGGPFLAPAPTQGINWRAIRMAATMLEASAQPCPAMSKAVP